MAALGMNGARGAEASRPNVVYVFADQWRAQSLGYMGNTEVKTPHIDALAAQSVNFPNAVSGCPVCSPYRGTLLTGRYPDKHGIFINDAPLSNEGTGLGDAFAEAGYQTGWIGKWHVDGHGRSSFIPRERRQGFQYWRVLECTHNYNKSYYYGDTPEKKLWDGYDVIAQTRDAQAYIRDHHEAGPFALVLSWGPPHNPYETAPEKYRAMYDPAGITLPPNVPEAMRDQARKDVAGYYAHCTAMDDMIGDLRATLAEQGLTENTIFVFTSDHGDMLGSQGEQRKQRPWDESIRVPFLLHWPAGIKDARVIEEPLTTVDIMPTLLGLCGIAAPAVCAGDDWTPVLRDAHDPGERAALIACYTPFGEWTREKGGREFRGVRTRRHTYVESLDGPWFLYDNETDPHQLQNLAGQEAHAALQAELAGVLAKKLKEADDEFLPGDEYVRRWKYTVDATGTMPYGP